jgi:hypothetical protein
MVVGMMYRCRLGSLLLASLVCGASACERAAPQPASAPASAPATQPVASAPLSPLLPESREWSQPDAADRLADEATRFSAVVRLLELSRGLGDPAELYPGSSIQRWRAAALPPAHFALGLATDDPDCLAAPFLLDALGNPLDELDDEERAASLLHVSGDVAVFPHVLIGAGRVGALVDEFVWAIVGSELHGATFSLKRQRSQRYVALDFTPPQSGPTSLPATAPASNNAATSASAPTSSTSSPAGSAPAAAASVELARYPWDPLERVFVGPVRDKLPDPPGGHFTIDLSGSAALLPRGGDLPEPPPLPPPPREPDTPPPPPQ